MVLVLVLLLVAFVEESTQPHSFRGENNLWYGYFWGIWTFDGQYEYYGRDLPPNQIGEAAICAYGFLGQGFCFNFESKRVVAWQRSNTIWNYDEIMDLVVMEAFSSNYTFNETIESVESGAFSHSESWGGMVVPAMVVLLCVGLWL